MNETQQTLLSAFVDGEMTEKELDQFLAAVRDDPSIKTAYMHMQHTSDLVKGYTSSTTPVDLTDRITPLLDEEPTYTVHSAGNGLAVISGDSTVWKQILGLTLAATVGAALMAMINTPSPVSVDPYQFVEAEPMVEHSATQLATSSSGNRWTVGENEVQDRLNDYLLEHNEYGGHSGVLSYARVVSYAEE